jgi:hypothetical protein
MAQLKLCPFTKKKFFRTCKAAFILLKNGGAEVVPLQGMDMIRASQDLMRASQDMSVRFL